MSYWNTLGIAPTYDRKTIKRAYSKLLKITRPEENPDGFQALREAYEFALSEIEADSNYGLDVQPLETSINLGKHDLEHVTPQSSAGMPTIENEAAVELQEKATASVTDKDKAWSPWPIVDTVITPIYDESDEASLIILWRELVTTDDFYNLDRKPHLEAAFLQSMAQYKNLHYPYNLFIEIYNYYNWSEAGQYLQPLFDELDYLNARIHSALTHQEIIAISKGEVKEASAEDRSSAKSILAVKPPKIKAHIDFFMLAGGRVKKYLHDIEEKNPLIMQEELNTPTVKWWHEQFNRGHLTILHLVTAVFMTFLVAEFAQIWFVEKIGVSAIPIAHGLLFIALSALVYSAHVGLKKFYSTLIDPSREWVLDRYYANLKRQVVSLLAMGGLSVFAFVFTDGFYGFIPAAIAVFLFFTQPFVRSIIVIAIGTLAMVFFTVYGDGSLIIKPLPFVAIAVWSIAALIFWAGFEILLMLLPEGLRNWISSDGEIYTSGTYSFFFIPTIYFSFKGIYLLFEQLEKLL